MSQGEVGGRFSKTTQATGSLRRSAATSGLTARVGRALGKLASKALGTSTRVGMMEHLEPRQLLDGSFASPLALTLTNGQGALAQSITAGNNASDNDTFRFTVTTAGFVSVLADTANESPASSLNTRVRIFRDDNTAVALTTGSDNGVLTSGLARDGWAGFVAEAGRSYFAVVSQEGTTSGTYTLRVNAAERTFGLQNNTNVSISAGTNPTVNPPVPVLGEITRLQEDIIYRYEVPSNAAAALDSLVTINAQVTRPPGSASPSDRLDSRIDVYRLDANGQTVTRIATDSDAGRLNDAYTTLRAVPGTTYFIRVRSDETRPTAPTTATGRGSFFLVADAAASALDLNAVTRRGSNSNSFIGYGDPVAPPSPNVPNPIFQTASYRFTSLGTGLALITAIPTPGSPSPVTNPALSIFDSDGNLIAFNDNFAGLSAQLNVQLIGGQEYFVVVDGFDLNSFTDFQIFIESNHTTDTTPANEIDDHLDSPTGLDAETRRRLLETATALVFGPSTSSADANGNLVRDRGYTSTATGTGRIQAAGDSDIFQFTPPVDMLGNYAGNNDDVGTSLFVGGAFTRAGTSNQRPTVSRTLTTWDANDYWYTGRQSFDSNLTVQYGFVDNPLTAGTDRPEIYALYDFDPAPTQQPAVQGTTDHWLVVAGDFNLVIPTPFGPRTLRNIAVWRQNINTGQFFWDPLLGDADAPVRALVAYTPPATYDVDGSSGSIGATIQQPIQQLYAGGDFTTIAGVAANAIASFRPGGGWSALTDITTGIDGVSGGSVFALAVYDPVDPGNERAFAAAQAGPPAVLEKPYVSDTPDIPASLVIGGSFTNAGAGGFTGVQKRGIALWTGVDFLDAASGRINAPPGQPPNPITDADIFPQGVIGGVQPASGINAGGTVFALSVYDAPDPDGAGPEEDPGPRLVAAGQFTSIGGVAVNNIAIWGSLGLNQDTDRPNGTPPPPGGIDAYAPQLLWQPLFFGPPPNNNQGTSGPVFALTTYDPPEINNEPDGTRPPVLVVGGSFTNRGSNIGAWNGTTWTNFLGLGVDGPVRALTTLVDAQEPNVAGTGVLNSGAPQQVLYAGGDFRNVITGPNTTDRLTVNRVAQFSAFHDFFSGQDFFAWATMARGVDTDTVQDFGPTSGTDPLDPPQFTPRVLALASFDDGDPYTWDRHDRPSTRMNLRVSPTFGSFINAQVRVFDSNFNVVYDFNRPGSNSVTPGQPDPAGMNDPSILRPTNAPTGGLDPQFDGITLWGGETYYIEVTDLTGGGTGRYNVTVTVDGLALDINGDGRPDEINGTVNEEPNEGRFSDAIQLFPNLQFGDTSNFTGALNDPLSAGNNRQFIIAPSLQGIIGEGGDLGNISTINDSDVWFFRATNTGTAEIRLQTRNIIDSFGNLANAANAFPSGAAFDPFAPGVQFTGAPATKRYNSALDGVVRVFRADFEQVAYSDNNTGILGDFQFQPVGTFNDLNGNVNGQPAGTEFYRKDPRVVIPVVAGNIYYIQVESGQRYRDGESRDPAARVTNIANEVDWRHATGSYMLLINQMPSLTAYIRNGQSRVDDHSDNLLTNSPTLSPFADATVIPIDEDPDSPTNGSGSLLGTIENRPTSTGGFVQDQDLFVFNAPGSGLVQPGTGSVVTITVTPTTVGGFIPNFVAFNNITGQNLGGGQAIGNGAVRLTATMRAGAQFGIGVFGSGGSEGQYTVSVTGVPAVDDYADDWKLGNATTIPVRDFLTEASLNGVIETPGDTDLFRFGVSDFTAVTVRVDATNNSNFDPFVEIYEVSESPSGDPILMRVGFNDDATPPGLSSSITIPVTPNRTANGRTYPYYYAVVKGASPLADEGTYRITITTGRTDDHADGDTDADTVLDTGEFNFATNIQIDPTNGQGASTGVIEIASDSDLFSFNPVAGGPSSVTVTRATGSLLRFRVTVLDATGAVIGTPADSADTLGSDSATVALSSLTRGQRYFVVVQPLAPNANTELTGGFSIAVNTPRVDDHANAGEQSLATAIILDPVTGIGQIGANTAGNPLNARFEYSGDTDLFTFTSILNGTLTITVTPFDTALGQIAPRVTLLNSTGGVIATQSAASPLGQVTVTATNALAGTTFYVLVEAPVVSGADRTGEYRVRIVGPNQGGGTGNNPDVVDFTNPTPITLDQRNGDGDVNDVVEIADDRDLFTFVTPNYVGTGKVFIQVVTPQGSLLDATVNVLRNPNELSSSVVTFDADGLPGVSANVSFDSAGNTRYWVIVDGVGASVGSYTIRVNTQPAVNRLYFPEGYANRNIREYISIVNPNDVAANYNIRIRYEDGDLETLIPGGSIAANSRGGTTLVEVDRFIQPGLRTMVGYSIIIESDVPLGATLAHYDFGTSIGDSFTEATKATWNFARVERDPGNVRDFVVFYNPNDFDVVATFTVYQEGRDPVAASKVVPAGRRSGFNIDGQAEFQQRFGVFSGILTSAPVDSANQATFIGVVASLSHYNAVAGTGFAIFGDDANKIGVAPSIAQGPEVDSELVFFNPNALPASVTLTGSYVRVPLPTLTRTFDIPAFSQVRITGATLGIAASQPVGIRYTSNLGVVLTASQTQKGDADAANTVANAGTRYFFGDAFIRINAAGSLYQETLNLYNPSAVDLTINVKLNFFDGFTITLPTVVRAKAFAEVKLHERPEIVNNPARTGNQWFSVDASGATPFVMTMTHYDLFLGGGWTTNGIPFGLVNSIGRVP